MELPVSPSISRARRYALSIPLRFRAVGEQEWRTGQLVNFSRTGLLFRTAHALPLFTEFEVRFNFSVISPESGPEARCTGMIVRQVAESEGITATAGRLYASEFGGETDVVGNVGQA